MKISKDIFKPLPLKVLLLLLISVISIPVLYQFNWSGFGEDSNKSKSIEKTIKDGKIISLKQSETEHFQSGKTLWDWLGLAGTLAIPIVLYLFQTNEQRRADKRVKVEKEQADELAKNEKDIAEANSREEAFQIYIDRMSEILINKTNQSQLFSDEYKDNPVKDIVRIRTTTILRILEKDKERQHRILHFLNDTQLSQFLFRNANLSSFDFSGLTLTNINFTKTNLSKANLSKANLSGLYLCSTNFSGANLSDANCNGANLNSANFDNANCSNANLSNTRLNNANCSNANFDGANLKNSTILNTKFVNADLSNTNLSNAITWDEIDMECNYELMYGEDEESGETYHQVISNETDFFGSKLTNANLISTNFKAAINLTPEQLRTANNWDEAIYENELFNNLGLPKPLRSIIDSMSKDVDEDEDVNVEKFIGYQVEVRNYIDHETKTIIKGEITGFSPSKRWVNVKTSSGEQLDRLSLSKVYVYQNQ